MSEPAAHPAWNRRTAGMVALLCATGFLVNLFKLELFFSCDFLFGSVFVMLVLLRYGLGAGVAVSLIVSSCSYLHWNHFGAVAIFSAETLMAGWLHRRRRWNLLTADLLFWCTGGLLLVFLVYHLLLGFSLQGTLVVALKQGVNGVLNTLVAIALDLLARTLIRSERRPPSLRQLLFISVSTLVILPSFAYLYCDLRRMLRQELVGLAAETSRLSEECGNVVAVWLDQNLHTVATLASLAGAPAALPVAPAPGYLDALRTNNPEFLRLGVLNGAGVTVAFSPAILEDGSSGIGVSLADRRFFDLLKKTRRPVLSEVFGGRIGRPGPRVVLAVPILAGDRVSGAAVGVLDTEKLARLLSSIPVRPFMTVTLLDQNRRVVASTRRSLLPREAYALPAGGRLQPVGGGVRQWIADPQQGVSSMLRWNSSLYLKEAAVSPACGWTVVLESSLKPTLEELSRRSMVMLAALAVLLLVIIVLSRRLSTALAGMFRNLEKVTRELPQQLVDGGRINWPGASTREGELLMANFQQMAEVMRQHVAELSLLNRELERRVDERTRALTEANRSLQTEVEERQGAQADLAVKQRELEQINHSLEELISRAVAEIRDKDQVLITQSRQAAMGEMIGNIAHQWRQPLNALGLLLANIKDAYEFHELDSAYLDRAVSEGNRLVRKMSSTINDFRNFFHPDKEAVRFSARKQIRDAVALVESSFGSEQVGILFEPADDLELQGFPNEYSQVLLNLLSNSRDAIVSRGAPRGRIEIVLAERDGRGCVTVTDNGGGIPPESLDRIFEPYYSTKELGTGIGLYMSKMIIERNMHGSIQARNVADGAQFTLLTPLAG